MGILKIYIVDDHQMLIDGLKALLSNEKNISVVGESISPKLALKAILEYKPDIVLTDINMPEIDGIELTKEIKKQQPHIKILALSMFGETSTINEMINAGANGYILKNTGKTELLAAIFSIANNINYYSKEISIELNKESNLNNSNEAILSQRELEVVKLIAKEYTNSKIAEALFISERTVETHRKNIFRKTETKSVIGLLKYCVEKRLIKTI